MGKKVTGISDEVIRLFMAYDFPGNVRELENFIEHAFVMCREGEITVEHLPKEFRENVKTTFLHKEVSLHNRFKDRESEIIKEALKKNRGLRAETARELGMHPSTLWRKMKKLGITEE
jgi:transcriptional regulator with PAS, ATPase and Fis domain